MRGIVVLMMFLAATLLPTAVAAEGEAVVTHALAMHGEPKYGPSFGHFDYVNPEAPPGGEVRLHAIGTFDSLNPYNFKGVSAVGLGTVFETLLTGSSDEAFTEYGLLAEEIEMPPDRSWVAFTLREEARWHDGRPVTVEDVIFSVELLKTKGHPFYRAYYASVEKAVAAGERKVRFEFAPGDNRELPLIVGQMPVLPKHYWEEKDFEKTTLDPPLGSGPYRIGQVLQGRSIVYERVADYWGRDLPVNRGRHNFGSIRYDYYRDATIALEAFKAGEYDFREENVSKQWATGYEVPAVREGRIRKVEVRHERPTGMQAFVFNTRRRFFSESRVRQALAYAFDFNWTNTNLFYGQYTRTESYFSNSELASSGLPGKDELEVLEAYRGRIPDEVFDTPYQPPSTDGSGRLRANLGEAMRLLKESGWEMKGGKLVHSASGEGFAFEILLSSPTWERIALPFKKNLERLGIDMVVDVFGQSLSPGNEQRDFWSSAAAEERGSRNTIGIRSEVVDELIGLVISAPDRESLIARTRALDRVLLWGHYVIPHWHIRSFRVAYWDMFGRPATVPKYALGFDSWWIDEARREALKRRGGGKGGGAE
jgi:microcin C transport system substrate-binding protein